MTTKVIQILDKTLPNTWPNGLLLKVIRIIFTSGVTDLAQFHKPIERCNPVELQDEDLRNACILERRKSIHGCIVSNEIKTFKHWPEDGQISWGLSSLEGTSTNLERIESLILMMNPL